MFLGIDFRANKYQVSELDLAHIPSHHFQILTPIGIVKAVEHHRIESMIISQAIAAKHFELIDEQSLGCWLLAAVVCFMFQHSQGHVGAELQPLFLGFSDDKCLEWREIVWQPGDGAAK